MKKIIALLLALAMLLCLAACAGKKDGEEDSKKDKETETEETAEDNDTQRITYGKVSMSIPKGYTKTDKNDKGDEISSAVRYLKGDYDSECTFFSCGELEMALTDEGWDSFISAADGGMKDSFDDPEAAVLDRKETKIDGFDAVIWTVTGKKNGSDAKSINVLIHLTDSIGGASAASNIEADIALLETAIASIRIDTNAAPAEPETPATQVSLGGLTVKIPAGYDKQEDDDEDNLSYKRNNGSTISIQQTHGSFTAEEWTSLTDMLDINSMIGNLSITDPVTSKKQTRISGCDAVVLTVDGSVQGIPTNMRLVYIHTEDGVVMIMAGATSSADIAAQDAMLDSITIK